MSAFPGGPRKRLHSGAEIPLVGLGTWLSEPGVVGRAVREAIEAGYRHVDCSPIYGNEPEVGEALSETLDGGTVTRGGLWVTSKLWNDRHEAREVLPALRETLRDLRLDALDLFLIHWPVALRRGVGLPAKPSDFLSPQEAPLEATWREMERAVDQGLVRHIGVSNFSARKLREVSAIARIPPAVNQVELHPYLQQEELLATCRELEVLATAYSPLGSPGRPERLREPGEPVLLEDPVVVEIAGRLDATPAQVLIAWALARGTAVIPKSTNPERIRENLAATDIRLSDDDMSRLGTLDRHSRHIAGHVWAIEGSPYSMDWLWDE